MCYVFKTVNDLDWLKNIFVEKRLRTTALKYFEQNMCLPLIFLFLVGHAAATACSSEPPPPCQPRNKFLVSWRREIVCLPVFHISWLRCSGGGSVIVVATQLCCNVCHQIGYRESNQSQAPI